jgi:nucleotide-binding universal stress UspA family protein
VVVGNCGFEGFPGLLVGSVAVQVAAHARCPVIVVRPHVEPAPADGRQPEGAGSVVVGVDGSRLSETAIEFAFAEAALRGVGVTAVHAWSYPLVPNTGNADRPVGAPGAPAGGALHQPRLRSSGQDLDSGCEFGQDPRRVGEVHPRLRVAVEPVVDSGVPVPSPVPKPPTPRRRATGS